MATEKLKMESQKIFIKQFSNFWQLMSDLRAYKV